MRQARAKVKELKVATRAGECEAAIQLLAHSVASGHDRLSVRRYFVARALGATDLDPFRAYCQAATRRMSMDALLASARMALARSPEATRIYSMAAELLAPGVPYLLPYDGVEPWFATKPTFCGLDTCVLGKVHIGARAFLAPGAVIRADGHIVRIGDDFCIGENSTVHIAHDIYPAIVADRVTAGKNTVIHACTIGRGCVIEDDVIVLDGSEVDEDVVIETGATVFPRSKLARGFLYAGSPARPIRELTSHERGERADRLREAVAASSFSRTTPAAGRESDQRDAAFVAASARLSGRVELGRHSSVFFGCRLEANDSSIVIGEFTNIQDNAHISCVAGSVSVGSETTIGHNVRMQDCHVGKGSLVAIGCVLAPGTIIEDDVFLAAGATTSPGQCLERGWLWGGRPARPLALLDDIKRAAMVKIISQYRAYAGTYHAMPERTATRRIE